MIHWKSTIENEVFWYGLGNSWEPETIRIWKKLCLGAETILDIGANTGVYSLIAKTLNPDAKVYAFEPSDLIFYKLERNNQLNKYDIQLINKGVSNITGELVFYDVEDTHQTSASLEADKLKNMEGFTGKIREYKIPTIRIDDFMAENELTKIDLVKIDVELHEPQVLEGFGKYLMSCKPIIIVEILTHEVAERIHLLVNKSDFDFYELQENGEIIKVEQMKPVSCFNYLIAPKNFDINTLL
jgi:FkbM family methyltransferase